MPSLFVITNHGQVGPFTRSSLRDALGLGQVSTGDQVRTPFGSPLGSVGRVLARQPRAAAETEEDSATAPPAESRRALPLPAILVLGVLAIALLVGSLVLAWPTTPAPTLTPAPAPKSGPVAVDPPISAQPPATPAASAANGPALAPTSSNSVATTGTMDPFVDLLPGRRAAEWQCGSGGLVQENNNTFRMVFSRTDAWVRTETMPQLRDFTGSEGLAISVKRSTAKQMVVEVVDDGSGKHFVATCKLQPHGCLVSLPWSSFVSRQDQQGRPDDGLQPKVIRWIGFQLVEPCPAMMQVHRIYLYR